MISVTFQGLRLMSTNQHENQMKRNLKWIMIILSMTMTVACDKNNGSEAISGNLEGLEHFKINNEAEESAMEIISSGESYANDMVTYQPPPKPAKQLVKKMTMKIKVNDVKKDLAFIVDEAAKVGGYVSSSDEKINQRTARLKKVSADSLQKVVNYMYQATIVVKIPAHKLEEFVATVDDLAMVVDHKSSKVDDVTSQMFDLNTRLATKRSIEQKYIELLKEKTGKLAEIMKVEAKIDEIRENIELMEASHKRLKQRVAYSSLQINIYQEDWVKVEMLSAITDDHYEDRYGVKMKKAIASGWYLLKQFTLVLFRLWPFIIFLIIIILIFKFRKKSISTPATATATAKQ